MRHFVALNLLFVTFLFSLGSCAKKSQPPFRPPAPIESSSADRPETTTFPNPTIEISASPSMIERGQQTTLSWNSTHATSLVLDGGIGNVTPSGSLIVSPPESITYTATAGGSGGEVRASTRVTVVDRTEAGIEITDIMRLQEVIRQGKVQPVFFEYDKADLTAEAKRILEENAGWLQQFPKAEIIIEGHSDERGTEEYNLALGDRRAQSTRQYLLQLEVDQHQLKTLSYGEELPFSSCHDESCWRQNRRAHFRLSTDSPLSRTE
jgi:peptidoglycan-associated lipoprotein